MSKNLGETIARNVQARMDKLGMSQNELARKINVSTSSVNSWLKNYAVPRQDKLDKMAELFGCSTFDLTIDEDDLPEGVSLRNAYPVPILGTICAGNGVVCNEDYEGQFFLDSRIKADFAVKVKGDSMVDAGIHHGDFALIRKEFDFWEGKIYAVIVGCEVMLKKVYKQEGSVVLMPCNDKYSPIVTDEAVLIGECIGVYHNVS